MLASSGTATEDKDSELMSRGLEGCNAWNAYCIKFRKHASSEC